MIRCAECDREFQPHKRLGCVTSATVSFCSSRCHNMAARRGRLRDGQKYERVRLSEVFPTEKEFLTWLAQPAQLGALGKAIGRPINPASARVITRASGDTCIVAREKTGQVEKSKTTSRKSKRSK